MADYTEAMIGSLTVSLLLHDTDGSGLDLGSVTYEDEETTNVYADVNAQLDRRASALRHQRVTIRLQGTDKDDLIEQENELRDELREEVNTLVFTPRGATEAVTFVLRRNPATRSPFDRRYEKGNVGYFDTELVAEPWGKSSTEALWAAASETSPAMVVVPALIGQDDPPLAMTVTRDGGEGFETVIVAVAPDGAAIGDYLMEAEDASEAGDWVYDDAVANPHGGAAMHLTETAWSPLAGFDALGDLPHGKYRMLARSKCSTGAGEDNCYIARGKQHDMALRDPRTRRLLVGHWVWEDLGEWTNYGGTEFTVYGKAIAGGLWVDCILAVPTDDGWMRYDDPDEDTEYVRFGWLYDHGYAITSAPTVERAAAKRMTGHGLKLPRAGCSLMLLAEPHASDPTPDVTVDGEYDPRWEMFATAPEAP